MKLTSLAFAAAVVLHTTDHFRQARGLLVLDPLVIGGGSLILVLAAVTLVMAWREHPRTAQVATVVGFVTAIGVTASHIAPYWSRLSDPYSAADLDAYSWAVMLLEVFSALILGAVALRASARPVVVEAGTSNVVAARRA